MINKLDYIPFIEYDNKINNNFKLNITEKENSNSSLLYLPDLSQKNQNGKTENGKTENNNIIMRICVYLRKLFLKLFI